MGEFVVFEVCEYKGDKLVSVDYRWDEDDDPEIEEIGFPHKTHKDVVKSKPTGNYSEVIKHRLYYDASVARLLTEEDEETIKAHLRHMVSHYTKIDNRYYQNMSQISKQPNSNMQPLFPTNTYIGHILNDGLYLSSDDFEIKYSRIAKKTKNITNEFGNPSIKYIIKGNFFGDNEVIIYERNSIQADIAVSHMCTDHIHWKNITDYLATKPEFELFEDSYLEKNYALPQNGYSLPNKVAFVRVLCSVVGKIGMVVLNVNFR